MPKSLHNPDTRSEVRGRLARLLPDSRPRFGRMSAVQMVTHLEASVRMALGELTATPKGKSAFTVFPLKQLFLYLLPWPKGAPTAPELLAPPTGDLAAQVELLEDALERLAASGRRVDWPAHPLFGALSGAEWGHLGYRHADHHLQQFGL